MFSLPILILGGLAGGSLLLLLFMLFNSTPTPPLEDRLTNLSRSGVGSSSRSRSQSQSRSRSKRVSIPDEERRKKLADRLVQAGIYKKGSAPYFLVMQVLLACIPVALAATLYSFGYLTRFQALAAGSVTGISGILFPGLYLDYCKRARQTAIRRAIPDALDVVIVCVEAGLSLPAALVRVAKELRDVHPMLATEFTIVHREVQLGATVGKALKNFSRRFDLDELRSLAAVVQQSERFGASIVNALRVHAETLREKRMHLAKERAQQASVKLLFPTVFFIFPALFVVIMGPAVFDIIEMLNRFQ